MKTFLFQVAVIGGGGQGSVLTVKADSHLRLECVGKGEPVPAVSWWKDDTMVTKSVIGGAVLELQQVDHWSSGEYTCRGENGVDQPAAETISMKVLAPPIVKVSSYITMCNLNLVCDVISTSPGVIKWWSNGLLVNKVLFSEVRNLF